MTSQFIELKLSAALKRRLASIADAGVLGQTVDDVVSHFTREALHRDWLEQEVQRGRAAVPPPPARHPIGQPPPPESVSERPQRAAKRLIRMPDVCNRIGVGRSSLYRMLQLGTFPSPKKLGGRTVAWLESDVDAWIESRQFGSGVLDDSDIDQIHSA